MQMAAASLLLRTGRRRAHGLLGRALSTTAGGASLSGTVGKKRLRLEYDPDRAVSIIEAIDTASLSAGSTRHALSLAVRRLSRSHRFDEADALLTSHLPTATTEPRLAAVLCAYGAASLPEKALSAFRSAVPSLPTRSRRFPSTPSSPPSSDAAATTASRRSSPNSPRSSPSLPTPHHTPSWSRLTA
jgi:hypothetical protein